MRAFLGMRAARQIMVVLELARHREEARCAEAVPRWTRPTWRLRARDERPPGSHVFEDDLFSFPPLVVLGAAPVSRTRRQRSLAMRPLSGPPARPDRRSQCEWSTCEHCFRAPMLSGLVSRTGLAPFAAPCCRFARCSTRWLTRWRDVRKDRAGAADNARRTARALRWSSGRCGASRQVARGAAGNLGSKGLRIPRVRLLQPRDDELRRNDLRLALRPGLQRHAALAALHARHLLEERAVPRVHEVARPVPLR